MPVTSAFVRMPKHAITVVTMITTMPTQPPPRALDRTPRYWPAPEAMTPMMSTPLTRFMRKSPKPQGLPSVRATNAYSPPVIGNALDSSA